jgi:adenylate kinase family enzyme
VWEARERLGSRRSVSAAEAARVDVNVAVSVVMMVLGRGRSEIPRHQPGSSTPLLLSLFRTLPDTAAETDDSVQGHGNPMQRIAIVGTSGSGKTTLAKSLAAVLDVKHVELDAWHWGPDWTPADLAVFRGRVKQALAGERWIADGNYSVVRDLVWARADTLLWIDDSFARVFWRLVQRTVRRLVRNEVLWHGNRENLRVLLFSRESLFVWAARTHWRYRREYQGLLRRQEYSHLNVIRFGSLRETRAWLSTLPRRR